MMLYWELFTVFFKIGLFSFGGGLAMISIIQQEVVGRGWIPAAEYARIITISQITPGPIAVNTATYVGARVFCSYFQRQPAIFHSCRHRCPFSPKVQLFAGCTRYPQWIAAFSYRLDADRSFLFYADNIFPRSRNRRNGKSADLFQILADIADGFAFLSALLP